MAKIRAGILSKVQGKVGGVVGATWKGKNYLREHVKPSNPNTPAQQLQRSKMSVAVKAASYFLGAVLTRFTNAFVKEMSAYNWFVKQNIASKESQASDLKDFKLAFGNMPTPAVADIDEWSTGSGGATFRLSKQPAPRAGLKNALVLAVVSADGSFGTYEVMEEPSTVANIEQDVSLPDDVSFPIYMSAFMAEVQDLGTANEKIIRLSNTITKKLSN